MKPLIANANEIHYQLSMDSAVGVRPRATFSVHERTALSEVQIGSMAIVRHVDGAEAVACRLMEMGVLPGTEVTLVRAAPLGDPLTISLRGYLLSIRRSEAVHVQVGPSRLAPYGSGAHEGGLAFSVLERLWLWFRQTFT